MIVKVVLKLPTLLLSLVCGAFLNAKALAVPCLPENFDGITVAGVARDASGGLLYCEWHKPANERQVSVEYRDTEGRVFASKQLLFDENFFLPQVNQTDRRSGEFIEVRSTDGVWFLDYRKNERASLEKTQVPQREVDVIDAGFDHKIRASWSPLMAGEKLRIGFAAPALQRVVALRVMLRKDEECPFMRPEWHCIWVEADNAVVRLFVEPLQLAYDGERRLRVFSGVVNIRDSAGNKQAATIEYVYAGEQK